MTILPADPPSSNLNTLVAGAEQLIDLGYLVLPIMAQRFTFDNVIYPVKRPAPGFGPQHATSDLEDIKRKIARLIRDNEGLTAEHFGLAVSTEGLIVLDDDRKGAGLSELDAAGYSPGETPMAVETRRGLHGYYGNPDIRKSLRNKLAATDLKIEKVDVKAESGYVICPPTVIDGVAYEWVKGPEHRDKLPELSKPLFDAIVDRHVPTLTVAGEPVQADLDQGLRLLKIKLEEYGTIPKGTRNETTVKLANLLGDHGYHPPEATALLDEHAMRFFAHDPSDPFTDGEIADTVRSAFKSRREPIGSKTLAACGIGVVKNAERIDAMIGDEPPGSQAGLLAREKTPATPFPEGIDAGLRLIGEAARAIAKKAQVPIGMSLPSVLVAACSAMQARVDVQSPAKKTFPISIFAFTIGGSGTRKTTADNMASQGLFKFQTSLVIQHAADMAEYREKLEDYKETRKELKKLGRKGDKKARAKVKAMKAPPPPLGCTLITTKGTIEGLSDTLAKGQPSLSIISSEGGRFFAGQGMKENVQGAMISGLTAMWDGLIDTDVTKTGGATTVIGKRASLHLGVQPVMVKEFLGNKKFMEQGILARTLVAEPVSLIGTRFLDKDTINEVDEEVEAVLGRFGQRLTEILGTPYPLVSGTRNIVDPPVITMKEDAQAAWLETFNDIEKRQDDGGDLVDHTPFACRIGENIARIAAVLAAFELADFATLYARNLIGLQPLDIIELRHVEAATALMHYYLAEHLRLVGQGEIPDAIEDAQKLEAYLQRTYPKGARFTRRDIITYGPEAYRTAPAAQAGMDILLDSQIIALVEVSRTKRYALTEV